MTAAVHVEGLVKEFGDRRVVDGVDLTIPEGTVLGLLGPNGAGKYSGGMRRRLDLAASMVGDPALLYLDEPTTGLDPRSRNNLWDAVRDLVDGGTTVLLTTQYMEEAEALADSIIVMDKGRVIA